jgi:hypothetical protein
MNKGMQKPIRGPVPVTKTEEDLHADVEILQRRIGERGDSATTVSDLASVGLVRQAEDGSVIATPVQTGGGPQGLYDFLKGFK